MLKRICCNPFVLLTAGLVCFILSIQAGKMTGGETQEAGAGPLAIGKNFKALGGGVFEVAALNTDTKMLYQNLDLAKDTDYRVIFEILNVSGQGKVNVDFCGPNYDNLQQEFDIQVAQAATPLKVDRIINSGNAPGGAQLRLFSDDPVVFTVRNLEVTYAAPPPADLTAGAFIFALLFVLAAGVQAYRYGRSPLPRAAIMAAGGALAGLASWYASDLLPNVVQTVNGGLRAAKNFNTGANGTFQTPAPVAETKMLYRPLLLDQNVDYHIAFDISKVQGRGDIVVDFCGTNYDNPEQEFRLSIGPATAPTRIDRVINSGNAPRNADLRLFSGDPVAFEISNFHIYHYLPALAALQWGCALVAVLLGLGVIVHLGRYVSSGRRRHTAAAA